MRDLETKQCGNAEEGKINFSLGKTRKGSREEGTLKLRLREWLEFSKEAVTASTPQ